MSDKTTPELEHKVISPKHDNKPSDDDECAEELDQNDYVINEKEPLNKNNIKTSSLSLNKKNEMNGKQNDSEHINSETRQTKLKKKNSYRVNKKNKNGNPNGSVFNSDKIHKMEEELRKRSGLSRSGLLLAIILIILLFVMFIALIVLVVIWPRNLHAQTSPICKTSACLLASSQMLPKLNDTVPICDNAREYSCGTWLKNNDALPTQHKQLWNMKAELTFKHKEFVRDFLVTMPTPEIDTSVPWKLKTFYDACMDVVSLAGPKELILLFNELGGWEILGKFKSYSWAFKKALVDIHSKHNGTPYFKIDVVPDPTDALQNIIRISPSGLGLPNKYFYLAENYNDSPIVQAYKTYMSDSVQLLEVSSSKAKAFSVDMFSYEQRLAGITPDDEELKDTYYGYKIVKLKHMTSTATTLFLSDILRAKFPKAKITESTDILVPKCDYVKNVAEMISTTGRETLNKYIMWNLAKDYFPYVSQIFGETLHSFRKTLYGEIVPKPRWEFCVSTLQKYMGLALAASLENNEINHSKQDKVVYEVFDHVKKTILQNYDQASWLDSELKSFILDKINNTSLQIGLPLPFNRNEWVNEYYTNFYVHKDDFFNTIVSARNFVQTEVQQGKLSSPAEEHRWLESIISSEMSVSYIVSANKVIVPRNLLINPFFDPEYSLPLIYSRLGVELSYAILSSVSPFNIFYRNDGAILDPEYPVVNASVRLNSETQPCIDRAIARSIQKPVSNISNITSYTTMTKISAVRQAFKALESVLSISPHIHQPAMETLEPSAVFFVSYSQSVCSIASDEHNQLLSTMGILTDKSLLNTVFTQSKEFTDTFSCSSDAELYTEESCPDVI